MKDFKLGIIVDSFRKDFKTNVEIAKELGADGIQMYMVEGELAPENMTPEKIAEVKQILSDNALEISAVCADLGGHGFARAEDNPQKIATSKRIAEIAKELGATVLTTHIGVIPEDKTCERYQVMQAACKELGTYAEEQGMFFAIETGPEKAIILKEFLDSLDCKGMAVNLDPANFIMVADQDPVEAVHLLKDYIVHTHAKDGIMLQKTDPNIIYDFFADGGIGDLRLGDYFLETPLGEGKVDFDAYLAALREIGFHGYLTIEREVGPDPVADVKMAMDLLRSKL
ncbi:MAG: sugar phosphate isomerase/epimerase [Clostridia bacterium]|nr:sugar phosphate isomerase/epimerase [Clostridia bacterium]